VIHERWGTGLSDEARLASELTVDLDAAETTCPACMATFDPRSSPGSCPDCGLALL